MRPALAFLLVGQTGWSAGLRRANTGALAYHMPYVVSLSSIGPHHLRRLVCGPAAPRDVPCCRLRGTPADAASEVCRLRLTCTLTIAVGLDLYIRTRPAKADD